MKLTEETARKLCMILERTYDPDLLRSIDETAAYMGTTPGAVQALIRRGELMYVQVGNNKHIAQSAIHDFIDSRHKAHEVGLERQTLVGKR